MYIEKEKVEEIATDLLTLNFTKSQTKRLLCNNKRTIGDLSNLKENYASYHDKMVSLGYSEYELHELACKFPKVMNLRFSAGKLRDDFDEYIKSLPQEQAEDEEEIYFEFNRIRKILKDLGVSKKRIDFIFSKNIDMLFKNPKIVEDNIKFYHSCGLTNVDLVRLINHHATILEYGESTYAEALKRMVPLGLTRYDFGKIIMNVAKARRILSNKELIDFIDFVESKPFDYDKLRKGIIKHSSLVTVPREILEDGYTNIERLGFSEEEAGEILSTEISIIIMSYDNLSYKAEIPICFGCTKKDARKIIRDYPGYLTQSQENLKTKFEVYYRRELLKYIIKKPKNIIQNAELTDGRAAYLKKYFPWIVEPAFSRMVFTSEETFKKRFNGNNDYVKKVLKNN